MYRCYRTHYAHLKESEKKIYRLAVLNMLMMLHSCAEVSCLQVDGSTHCMHNVIFALKLILAVKTVTAIKIHGL